MIKSMVGRVHSGLIFGRRTRVLTEALRRQTEGHARILDVGTGDGKIARDLATGRPGTEVQGIDVFRRPHTHIPVTVFDGQTIPFPDGSFDAVTFSDVLHHTDDPLVLIREAARVSRGVVVIKDHLSENALDHATLRLMDWVGNAPHGVRLPYNYASRAQWLEWFRAAGLEVAVFDTRVPLYAFPLGPIFGRGLHFVAQLRVDRR
jgi:ubiquinone/menaquinone biosynthesis C-methylase UbiE